MERDFTKINEQLRKHQKTWFEKILEKVSNEEAIDIIKTFITLMISSLLNHHLQKFLGSLILPHAGTASY